MSKPAEGAAKAIQMWLDDDPMDDFGAWLAKNCIVDLSRAPRACGWGGTFHERKAERIAARKAAGK